MLRGSTPAKKEKKVVKGASDWRDKQRGTMHDRPAKKVLGKHEDATNMAQDKRRIAAMWEERQKRGER